MADPLTTIDGFPYYQFDIKNQDEFKRVSELISTHLSEPYSIYVYWYFLNNWPQYCFIVKHEDHIIGRSEERRVGKECRL